MSQQEVKIAPSLLAVDPCSIGEWAKKGEEAGADWHHIDVMDGHFVPNLSFGIPLVKALKGRTSIPLDVHIMVSNPDVVAMDYIKAGADILCFHIEAALHPHRLIKSIQDAGAKASIALNPGTAVELVFPLLDVVDGVMFMSVNPGFGGQSYISHTEVQIAKLRQELAERSLTEQVFIQIDGGITEETIVGARKAGANVFVAGSAVYRAPDIHKAVAGLREKASTQ